MIIRMLKIALLLFLTLPIARCAAAQRQTQNTVDSIFAKGQVWELRDSSGRAFTLTVPHLDTKLSLQSRYLGPVTLNHVPSLVVFSYEPYKADTGLITIKVSAINLSQLLICYTRNPGEIRMSKILKGIAVNNLEDVAGPSYYIRTGEQGSYKSCTLKRLR